VQLLSEPSRWARLWSMSPSTSISSACMHDIMASSQQEPGNQLWKMGCRNQQRKHGVSCRA
jgi:predicted alpha/beta superfamily hydrolase